MDGLGECRLKSGRFHLPLVKRFDKGRFRFCLSPPFHRHHRIDKDGLHNARPQRIDLLGADRARQIRRIGPRGVLGAPGTPLLVQHMPIRDLGFARCARPERVVEFARQPLPELVALVG